MSFVEQIVYERVSETYLNVHSLISISHNRDRRGLGEQTHHRTSFSIEEIYRSGAEYQLDCQRTYSVVSE